MAKELGAACYLEHSSITRQGLKEAFEESVRVVLNSNSPVAPKKYVHVKCYID
jgi:hypothetical protein